MVDTIEKKDCTGCKMCKDICPFGAIEFICDKQGFWYPKINKSKCTKCGLCIKKCPSLNHSNQSREKWPDVYAAWSKDDNIRISSTSGGAFWVIAEAFIKAGGVVVGCRYKNDWKAAEHAIAYNIKELYELKGSKYFQSDTDGIYKKVKNELEKGTKVLFCGTPCQNQALKVYLNFECENLYCLDFICRSINSPKAFKAYLEELENSYDSCVVEVQLKNKNNGWNSLASRVKFENGMESILDKNEDWWVKGFIYNDLYTREACFNCKYKVLPRVTADISIGDFWGIKGQKEDDIFNGISAILINNDKGKELFNMAKEGLSIKEFSIDDVIPGNPALLKNPIKTSKQDVFFDLLEKHPFSYCVKKCTQSKLSDKFKLIIKRILRKCKRTVKLLVNGKISKTKYLYYNYLCKNIIRDSGSRLIPYKGAILDLHPTAKIYLKGKNLEVGFNKLKGSKSETHVRMNKNAIWNCNNGCLLFYNTVLEVKENAKLDTGFFSANSGSVIIAHKNISLGEDVMCGRNVIIYDSDFHSLLDKEGNSVNVPKTVKIEDHVWLTTDIVVLKGVTIKKDSLVTAQTVVNKDMPEHSIIAGGSSGKVIRDEVSWSRETCPME